MKFKDIKQKNDKELATLLADSRKQVSQLAIDMKTKQVANVKEMAAVKKTIARTLTELRSRQFNSEGGES